MTGNLSKLNELINTANYAKAEFLLYDLIQKNPNDYNLNKNLGMVLLAQKNIRVRFFLLRNAILLTIRILIF